MKLLAISFFIYCSLTYIPNNSQHSLQPHEEILKKFFSIFMTGIIS